MSLSVCPDGELPWALRGLQRWRDSELLRVNNVTLAVEQAITQLDVLWNSPGLMQRLIDSCIVEGELQRRDIAVSTADIQSALNGLRRQRGLQTAAALQAWMESSGVSRAALQDIATKLARKAKLRESIAATRMKAPADSPLTEFDEIKMAVLEVDSEADALYAAEVVRAGQMQLAEVAQEVFLRASHGHVQITLREEARHALATELEGCDLSAGAVHVHAEGDVYRVIHVLAVKVADAGPQTMQRLKARLFEDWLAEQRRAARIEWFWGDARRTATDGALN
jgi:putative peptide maturation system protein